MLKTMADVTAQETLERADELLDRVAAGQTVTMTRDGIPFADLRPLPTPNVADAIEEAWQQRRQLPPTDLAAFRRDLDAILDPYA